MALAVTSFTGLAPSTRSITTHGREQQADGARPTSGGSPRAAHSFLHQQELWLGYSPVEQEAHLFDLLLQQLTEEVDFVVEIGRQDALLQVADQLLQHLLEPGSEAALRPVRTGGAEVQDDVRQGAAAQFAQGRVAPADAVQDAEAALPGPGVASIQLPHLRDLRPAEALQPEVFHQSLGRSGQQNLAVHLHHREEGDAQLHLLVFHLQPQLPRGHDRADEAPQETADGRPVDGGHQHLVQGLVERVGGEVPTHEELVPGAAPAREILQIPPLDHPVPGVSHHGVLPWDEAPVRGVEDHGQHEVDVVSSESPEAVEQGTAEEEAAEGQLRALVPQEVLQLGADAAGQLPAERRLRLVHGRVAAGVQEELLLQREAARGAGFDLRRLRRCWADPGLWCWWWSRREQGLAEVLPSLPLGRFLRRFDQGQVLPALLQGLPLGFGIAFIARARGSVYQPFDGQRGDGEHGRPADAQHQPGVGQQHVEDAAQPAVVLPLAPLVRELHGRPRSPRQPPVAPQSGAGRRAGAPAVPGAPRRSQ
ncbi:uncharacterized protein LOC121078650 [Cygnus olor]|uniref:uncharacterized protein LOC121078650 n=1 Tax=Cygnus olor TaxID=8869 RepID=UPI001ADE31ED|nr:uncharacterized protein LOC121078650 [Cygnus olor]